MLRHLPMIQVTQPHSLLISAALSKSAKRKSAFYSLRAALRVTYRGLLSGAIGLSLNAGMMAPAMAQPFKGAAIAPSTAQAPESIQDHPIAQAALDKTSTVESSELGVTNAPIQLAARTNNSAEIRSIWLDRETIVNAKSPQGLAKVFERFKAAGINTVFVETVNAGYPIYPSTVAPEQNPLTKGWDPLAAAVDLGKAYNIEVHAWVWIFAAGNQAHNPLVGKPASYPGPILSAHPDWAGKDNKGNLIIPGQTKPFLDPANPEVRSYLHSLLSEIVTRYDVDGIQLDYIRYPFQDHNNNQLFGYGTAARAQFKDLTGVDPTQLSPNSQDQRIRYLWNQWTAFRTQQVTTFVAETAQRLRRQDPTLTISAAVFADDTYKRQQTLQQDWEDWADQGLVDWIVLMSYASSTDRFAELIRPWLVESSYRHTQVIPGIRLLNLPPAVAAGQLQMLRDMSTHGYALFAADNLNGEVQTMLSRMQGERELAGVETGEEIANRRQ
ncbi:MAG: hypothetical protein DCF25_00960 [Leptolyngbya foveolarum]|uniref:Glycosyl hydrolase-like 10 domain-containing protein n=1 Tax=Leptolyngbya foveolarum TaxID=47253 RepID=A0A2W4WLM0_9CYAN|nr:MAG: hypothetical protein DCF25_00960 [Leptolyngbya foveolarum]